MNTWLINKKQSFTFRQWSGKAYSIFASIGKEINIGHVDIDICNQSLLKGKKCYFLTLTDTDENLKSENEEINDLQDLNVDQFISLLSIVKNRDISSGQSSHYKINLAITFILPFRILECIVLCFITHKVMKLQSLFRIGVFVILLL